MAVLVDSWQEEALHLVVAQLVARRVRSYEQLARLQRHHGVIAAAQSCQLLQVLGQVIRQPWGRGKLYTVTVLLMSHLMLFA